MKRFLLIFLCTLALFSASAQSVNEKRIIRLINEINLASNLEDSTIKNRYVKELDWRLQIRKFKQEKKKAQVDSLKLQIIDLYLSAYKETISEKKLEALNKDTPQVSSPIETTKKNKLNLRHELNILSIKLRKEKKFTQAYYLKSKKGEFLSAEFSETNNEKRIRDLNNQITLASNINDSILINKYTKEQQICIQNRIHINQEIKTTAETLRLFIIQLNSNDSSVISEKNVIIQDSISNTLKSTHKENYLYPKKAVLYKRINPSDIINRSGFYLEGYNGLGIGSYNVATVGLGFSFGCISYLKNLSSRNRYGFIARSNVQYFISDISEFRFDEVNIDIFQFGPYFSFSKNDKIAFEFGFVNGLAISPRYEDDIPIDILNLTALFRIRISNFAIGFDIDCNLQKLNIGLQVGARLF
ncbi:MAG: hypothetical protein IPO21_16765 [Bacteroidales bacterium]|nr:hypothetical protein [Bacteroidales bacterium]